MMPNTPERDVVEDDGIGGDDPFCEHGDLLESEDCDECAEGLWALSEAITNAASGGD